MNARSPKDQRPLAEYAAFLNSLSTPRLVLTDRAGVRFFKALAKLETVKRLSSEIRKDRL